MTESHVIPPGYLCKLFNLFPVFNPVFPYHVIPKVQEMKSPF